MVAVAWVLYTALDTVWQGFVAAVGAIVDDDVAAEWRGSGLKRGGCVGCRGELG
jgi:hypothetical protein